MLSINHRLYYTIKILVFQSYWLLLFVQDEVDNVAEVWDAHSIRPSKNPRVPSGRPNIMYAVPDLYGTTNKLCTGICDEHMLRSKEMCLSRSLIPCDIDVYNICSLLMARENVHIPEDVDTAKELYLYLRQAITNIE